MSSLKDISPPRIINDIGALHPINQMKDALMNMLMSLGFEVIDGPEIETEEFNFDMLNIKKSHLLEHLLCCKLVFFFFFRI